MVTSDWIGADTHTPLPVTDPVIFDATVKDTPAAGAEPIPNRPFNVV